MRRLIVGLIVIAPLALPVDAEAFSVTRCSAVTENGTKFPVSVHKYSCRKARPIVRYWARNDEAPAGWKVGNLGGCEWQFARKGGSLYDWKISTVKMAGCRS